MEVCHKFAPGTRLEGGSTKDRHLEEGDRGGHRSKTGRNPIEEEEEEEGEGEEEKKKQQKKKDEKEKEKKKKKRRRRREKKIKRRKKKKEEKKKEEEKKDKKEEERARMLCSPHIVIQSISNNWTRKNNEEYKIFVITPDK